MTCADSSSFPGWVELIGVGRGGADPSPYFYIWEPEHLGLRVEALWVTIDKMRPLLEKEG